MDPIGGETKLEPLRVIPYFEHEVELNLIMNIVVK